MTDDRPSTPPEEVASETEAAIPTAAKQARMRMTERESIAMRTSRSEASTEGGPRLATQNTEKTNPTAEAPVRMVAATRSCRNKVIPANRPAIANAMMEDQTRTPSVPPTPAPDFSKAPARTSAAPGTGRISATLPKAVAAIAS